MCQFTKPVGFFFSIIIKNFINVFFLFICQVVDFGKTIRNFFTGQNKFPPVNIEQFRTNRTVCPRLKVFIKKRNLIPS